MASPHCVKGFHLEQTDRLKPSAVLANLNVLGALKEVVLEFPICPIIAGLPASAEAQEVYSPMQDGHSPFPGYLGYRPRLCLYKVRPLEAIKDLIFVNPGIHRSSGNPKDDSDCSGHWS